MDALQKEEILEERPVNFCLLSNEELLALQADCEGLKKQCTLLAELFARLYWKETPELKAGIGRWLTHGELGHFLNHPREDWLEPYDWQSGETLADRAFVALKHRMKRLKQTDGFIPVFRTGSSGGGVLLPFQVESAEAACCKDWKGHEIPEWTEALQGMPVPLKVTVQLVQAPEVPPLTGRSLMLPVYLAFLRKNHQVPEYNPFRVFASGILAQDGSLEAVEVEAKSKCLRGMVDGARFFYPESLAQTPQPGDVLLPVGVAEKAWLTALCIQMEGEGQGEEYTAGHVQNLTVSVNRTTFNKWEGLVSRLVTHLAALDEDKFPEENLALEMLLSSACCHAGKTREALTWNRKGSRSARFLEKKNAYLRMDVERMVCLQDQEAFPEIQKTAAMLEPELLAFNDADLLMRYYGTLGQVHVVATLQGLAGFSKECALDCFKKAVEYAKRKNRTAPALEDIVQDLNYLHLWHAFFQPGTEEEREAFQVAWKKLGCLKEEPQSVRKNQFFLKRQELLACYRALKLGMTRSLPDEENDPILRNLLEENEACFWIRATSLKYHAVFLMHQGKQAQALREFHQAADLAPKEKPDAVIALIFATVLVQAYVACREYGLSQEAESFSRLAHQWFEAQAINSASAQQWRAALETASSTADLPDSYY